MRVSLKDVALLAGVSIKTVSNVVNHYEHVTPTMRAKVQRAIDELGYRPNLTARHLRKGRTGIIALAVPELGNPYFAELAGEVIDAAAAHDLTVLLDHTRGEREREVLVSQGFRARVIDGLILSPLELDAGDLAARTDDVPLVLLGEREYPLPYPHIAIDNVAAARAAVRHLLKLGRHRIAFLGARTDSPNRPAQLRLQGWREELTAAGLEASERLAAPTGGWDRGDGAEGMARLLDSGVRPDAVFAYNDLVAVGALRVLHERGLRVPWDVAVVGFDDVPESRFGAVSLTTIAPDKSAIARLAVESLVSSLERAADKSVPADEPASAHSARQDAAALAPFELLERESTLGRR